MEAVADWITQGRFGVLVYLGERFLYVLNTAGQYEPASEVPADFAERPVRVRSEATVKWELVR